MFNFEKIKQSIKNTPHEIKEGIRKMRTIDYTRSSPLPNPMDDSIEKTQKFWDRLERGAYDGTQALEITAKDSNDNVPKKAA